MDGRYYTHIPLGGYTLTDKALRAIGIEPSTDVPYLDLPWRDDTKDVRTEGRL